MPLYLTEADVGGLLTPGDAVPVWRSASNAWPAARSENGPRRRLALDEGIFAVMSAVDEELGYAGLKSYTVVGGRAAFAVVLFDLESGELAAVLEADTVGQRRTGAASGVAAKHLARPDARSLGVIGCGWQAEAQIAAMQAACRGSSASSPTAVRPSARASSARRSDAEPAETHARPPSRTSSSRSPPRGTPSSAATGCGPARSSARSARTSPSKRELDNVVLERAAFVCCDSSAGEARVGDLIEPVASGVLDWLEVHELHEVVAGEVAGAPRRRHRRLQVERDRGVGRRDRRRRDRAGARARSRDDALDAATERFARDAIVSWPSVRIDVGPVEQPRELVRVEAVLDVAVVQDVVESRPRSCSRIT